MKGLRAARNGEPIDPAAGYMPAPLKRAPMVDGHATH
jgi:hypothetical protein